MNILPLLVFALQLQMVPPPHPSLQQPQRLQPPQLQSQQQPPELQLLLLLAVSPALIAPVRILQARTTSSDLLLELTAMSTMSVSITHLRGQTVNGFLLDMTVETGSLIQTRLPVFHLTLPSAMNDQLIFTAKTADFNMTSAQHQLILLRH